MDSFLIKNKEIIYRAHQILNSGVHGGSVYAAKGHATYIYTLIFVGVLVCAFIFARDTIMSIDIANIYRSMGSYTLPTPDTIQVQDTIQARPAPKRLLL